MGLSLKKSDVNTESKKIYYEKFDYSCQICNSKNIKILEQYITEVNVEPIDIDGSLHHHDFFNEGPVYLLCENKHKTEQNYKPACQCGWIRR